MSSRPYSFSIRLIVLLLGLLLIPAGQALVTPAQAQQSIVLSKPYNTRIVIGPNLLERYVEGDHLRIGVFVNQSDDPTTVIATQGTTEVTLARYGAPAAEDIYEIDIPYDPALHGPWTVTVTRGNASASVQTPGVATAFPVPLVENVRIETVDGVATLMWTWPDLSAARSLGLTLSADIGIMQTDNHDEFQLNFGLTEHPLVIGDAGDTVALPIPTGLEGGMLFLFRVHLTFRNAGGDILAYSVAFADDFWPAPQD